MDNPVNRFSEDDAWRLYHPHDDALVVSLQKRDYKMHRVLVDNGSSIDIMYYPAFQQMRIDRERLTPTNAPLMGFGGSKVFPLGAITLAVTASDYPQQITKEVTFLIVDCSSAYNAILRRPTLNSWKAVTSTYHLMIKFPTEYGVGELRENQIVARECYIAMLEMEDQQQTMCIGKQRALVEPVEELEEVRLNDTQPERMTKIGTLASWPVRQTITTFLRDNQDMFAWSHEDMPGIDPSVMVHKLNVSPSFPQIRQKKRVFAQERDKAIAEEVRKLLEAGFIREVYYPDWLANVFMVKRPIETGGCAWTSRTSTSYNQIRMDESDQEKTSFVTSQRLFCYKVYVDDMLVKSLREVDHLDDLRETFDTLRSFNMKLNPNKCAFGVTDAKFLGFMMS
ncbi:uncharacterized protein LOC115991148 [Quercus lobata]|uniref:uncharacterized protein LOC115991148 n=1 Tax=Quercus lobata TaxID=97700 RepID=UPI0012443589|nr:uncharacterized protein LOC115991148 [Quercus lobata]